MELHMNNLLGGGKAVVNLSTGVVNATMNFFGCAGGAGTTGCGSVSGPLVSAAPWLSAPVSSAPGAGAGKNRP
jgi:hypothetical protein